MTVAAGLAALTVVAFAPQSANAACAPTDDFADVRLPTTCLSAQESKAVQMRMFRAELAVAALSCRQQSLYNTVVTRHQDELVREGRALRGIFQRVFRAGAERELNRFITHLANRASLKRLTQPTYCQTMARVFREAQAQPRQGLLAYVQGSPANASTTAAATPPPNPQTLAAMDTAAGKSGKPVLDD